LRRGIDGRAVRTIHHIPWHEPSVPSGRMCRYREEGTGY
jgi:hypothetical protein